MKIRIGTARPLSEGAETRLVQRPDAASPPPGIGQITPPITLPTPLDRSPGLTNPLPEPPAPAPAAAAPLALAVAPGPGEGAGSSPSGASAPVPPLTPVTRTLALSEALRLLADRAGVIPDVQILGEPTVDVTGEPSGDLVADLAALMTSVRPPHYAAISSDRTGKPARLIVSPYPIVGARQ